MSHLPFTEKYRPTDLNDIYVPNIIKKKINDIINEQNIPNLIISGPSGTGKSSIIKIIAKEIYKDYYQEAVLEMGLMEDRGIKFMQSNIIPFCRTKIPYLRKDEKKYPKYKLIIFDEADNIISRMQDMISNVMENYGENIRFVFTCNSATEICENIQGKTLIWRLSIIPNEIIVLYLKNICLNENIGYTENALLKIAKLSQGDMRSSINKLELICNKYDNIKDENVDELCNIPQEIIIRELFDNIIKKNLKKSLEIIFDLRNKSYSGSDITLGMLSTIRSSICNDLSENIKMKFANDICKGIYNISNIIDSDLQLACCVVNMCN